MPGGRKPRHDVSIPDRRRKVAELYLRRRTQAEIARELKVSRPTIAADLSAIRDEWQESTAAAFNARKAEELARIDHLEREAWEAWDRSRQPAETVTQKDEYASPPSGGRRSPKPTDRTTKTEGRDGNPAFLEKVAWCIEQRCKILGLYAPEKLLVAGAVAVLEGSKPELSRDELATLTALANRAGVFDPPRVALPSSPPPLARPVE